MKTFLPLLRVFSLPGKFVSTELFPSNGCCTVACLHSCYLTTGLHITELSVQNISVGSSYVEEASTLRKKVLLYVQ
jgi:hypothetical protein